MTLSSGSYVREKVALSVGCLAVAAAALAARSSPATGYELSVYATTPAAVWVGLGVAVAAALFVGLASRTDDASEIRAIAVALGGLATIVFAGLPIVRGYRYFGHHDSLTHLGWASGIGDGAISPWDLFYPAVHLVSVLVRETVGVSMEHSILLAVLLATAVFLVFVPLCVGAVVSTPPATAVAAFSAMLLLPITTLSTHMYAHAMSQAVLFSALFVYLLAKYVTASDGGARFTAVGAALALTSVSLAVYHPQLVAHLIVAALGICAVQFLVRRWPSGVRTPDHQPVYGQTVVLVAVFAAWSSNYGFFVGVIRETVVSAAGYLLSDGGQAGEAVASQGSSLDAIGVSVLEVAFKLLFPHVVFSLLAGGFVLAVLFGVAVTSREVSVVTTHLASALAALGALFVVYFVASASELYFRVFGLMMVFVGILGALAIHHGCRSLTPGTRAVRPALAVGFAILLALSLLAAFPSPYVYHASPHVTEMQLQGYETAFESADEDVPFAGLRDGPNRYQDALYGGEGRTKNHETVPEEAFDEPLASYYDSDRYLVVTDIDYQREDRAYQGLRYTADDLDGVATQPAVDRVQSNGEFDLYFVDADESEPE